MTIFDTKGEDHEERKKTFAKYRKTIKFFKNLVI